MATQHTFLGKSQFSSKLIYKFNTVPIKEMLKPNRIIPKFYWKTMYDNSQKYTEKRQ